MDMGDFVVIINAEKIAVTGNKEIEKKLTFHTLVIPVDQKKYLLHQLENQILRKS